ncbi:MAG: CoA activase, partial [Desulfobacteraceae bacterium]|nr:CoA activase [Desulfobacteraceae bacterium]
MIESTVLGIDIGSVTVSVVEMAPDREIVNSASVFHHGDINQTLETILTSMDLTRVKRIAATSSTPGTVKRDVEVDDQVAIIRAAKHLHGNMGSILNVGGEKFSLSLFDQAGNYTGSRTNTSCAAGTGSFLDQQAGRLELATANRLSCEACKNAKNIPDIATRCAVFAKTDLIHAQQEGFSVPQISEGLCQGLARNIFNTVFTKGDIRHPVIFCGGVSKNESVRSHLEALIDAPVVCDDRSHLYGGIGAALGAMEQAGSLSTGHGPYSCPGDIMTPSERSDKSSYPPLSLTLSDYPDFKSFKTYMSHGVESDIYIDPKTLNAAKGYLGMDVGSTSTKGVIITDTGAVVAGFYTRTASKPVDAVQKIFRAMDDFINTHDLSFTVMGCGTTGSGRKLSGGIIGADLILDEITAHARAAHELNNDV